MPLPTARAEQEAGKDASTWTVARVVLTVSYAALAAALLATRLLGLGHSLWLDEAHFVEHFVRAGPQQILTGGALSHQFYGVLDWLTASVIGESYVAFRLWSVIPFILGVALVTVWLHKRHDPIAGVLFLFLATVSPLLLDITRQARGYGLAFLAMAVVIVAALEARRSGRASAVVPLCAAGIVGAWTLPQVGIAFLATLAVLWIDRRLRWPVAIGFLASSAAIVAWYAPHLRQVQAASQMEAGAVQVHTTWVVTAPIDQILLPALIWIDGAKISASVAWLPFVVLAVLVMGSSPFVRKRDSSTLILCAGPIATVVALWLADAYSAPRYLSFLLVPLFMLLASGAAAIFRSISERRAILRTAVCLVAIAVLAVHFAMLAPDVVRRPREANRETAQVIESRTPATTPVYASLKDTPGLDFYLDRPFQVLESSEVVARVCESDRPLVYVTQPWAIRAVDVPCLQRDGVEHYRFVQYARGGEINVWLVPSEE